MREELPLIQEVDVSEMADDQKSELASSVGSKTSEMGPKLMLKVWDLPHLKFTIKNFVAKFCHPFESLYTEK